jgi:hypothetical protein
MIKHRLYNKGKWGWNLSLLALVMVTMVSCNKDFENKRDLSVKSDTASGYKAPKVLYIILDGARGASINTVQAPALTEISENALHSFNSLSDENGLESTSWADMLTGVNKAKHKVTTADFSGNNLANYPMFFKQIKQANSNLRTAAFSSSPAFSQQLISNADVNENFNNDDEAVKTALVKELKQENASVIVAEFNGIEKAGKQYGYDASVAQYSAAILTVDAYIGAALKTLKERPSYDNENWLVVVASNKGGDFNVPPVKNDGTLFSKPLLNSFVLFYNPRFSFQYYAKPATTEVPYEGNVHPMGGDTTANVPAAKSALYNFGITGDFTVELKIKVLKFSTSAGNAPILFKSSSPANAATGWWIIHSGNTGGWRLGGLTSISVISNQPALQLNQWYTLGFKVYTEGGKRWAMIYQDGVKAYPNPVDITNRNANNNEELVAGFRSGFGSATKQLITEIKVFKTAIPDAFIASNACEVGLNSKHPYYNQLISYWPATDGGIGVFKDQGPAKNDFELKKYKWESFSEYAPKLCVNLPLDIYTRIPNGIDIPSFIYGWMGMKSMGLNLDGKTWIPVYNTIKP